MKNMKYLGLVCIIVAALLMAFKNWQEGAIIGRITPPAGAASVMVISSTDTIKAEVSDKGIFQVPGLKPKVYKIIIEAKPPFKNTTRENIPVKDGTTDIGEIVLKNQ